MPVFETFTLKTSKIAIWHILESTDTIVELSKNVLFENDKRFISHFSNQKRLREFLAVRLTASYLNGNKPLQIFYDNFGKPSAQMLNIGISHTTDFAACIIDSNKNVSIDIEKISTKTKTIAKKFLSTSEIDVFDTSDENITTLLWSAKEAVYKYYGKKNISFAEQINILPFKLQTEGYLTAILQQKAEFFVYYKFFDKFVLTVI